MPARCCLMVTNWNSNRSSKISIQAIAALIIGIIILFILLYIISTLVPQSRALISFAGVTIVVILLLIAISSYCDHCRRKKSRQQLRISDETGVVTLLPETRQESEQYSRQSLDIAHYPNVNIVPYNPQVTREISTPSYPFPESPTVFFSTMQGRTGIESDVPPPSYSSLFPHQADNK